MATKTTTDATVAARDCALVLAAADFAVGSAEVRAKAQMGDRLADAEKVLAAAREAFETSEYEAGREYRSLVAKAQTARAAARETALGKLDAAMADKWAEADVSMRAVPSGGFELVAGRRRVGGYLETAPGAFRVDGPGGMAVHGSEVQARTAVWDQLGTL